MSGDEAEALANTPGVFRDMAKWAKNSQYYFLFQNSPLVVARVHLADYILGSLKMIYRDDVGIFRECVSFMHKVSAFHDSFDQLISDGLEESALEFRKAMVTMNAEQRLLTPSSFQEFLLEFDLLLERVVSLRALRHRLTGELQSHFYHAVLVALEGRQQQIFAEAEFDKFRSSSELLTLVREARDNLYLNEVSDADVLYLQAVKKLMSTGDYLEWLSQAAWNPVMDVKSLEQIQQLTDEFELALLWHRHAVNGVDS